MVEGPGSGDVEGLLSIGELARTGGLPVSALRFYDGAGVLVPAAVDPRTAGLGPLLAGLPDGLDTPVGADGTASSGPATP